MTRRRPAAGRARAQRLDVLVGILGFFTAAALLQAVVLEVTGRPAVGAALVLAALTAALGLAVRARRRTGVRRDPPGVSACRPGWGRRG